MTDVADLIFRTWDALKNKDMDELREISHQCSEEAAVTQNPALIQMSIISYSFNKLLSKIHYRDKLEKLIKNSLPKLNNGDFEGVISEIDQFDQQNSFFEGSLIEKAKVKIASRLYSSGLSLSQSAELVEVRVSELLDYVGVTKIHDETKTISAMERLKIAREVFR